MQHEKRQARHPADGRTHLVSVATAGVRSILVRTPGPNCCKYIDAFHCRSRHMPCAAVFMKEFVSKPTSSQASVWAGRGFQKPISLAWLIRQSKTIELSRTMTVGEHNGGATERHCGCLVSLVSQHFSVFAKARAAIQ
jgi:hypothetical protein